LLGPRRQPKKFAYEQAVGRSHRSAKQYGGNGCFGRQSARERIGYDPQLIAGMIADHRKLLEPYKEIQSAVATGQCPTAKVTLRDLKAGLQERL
jgi:hypothetical protein